MQKTKVKIGISFVLMALAFLLSRKFLLFINYIVALIFHEMAHIYVKKEKPRPGKRSAAFPCRQAYRSFFIPSSLLRVGINIPLKNEKVNK